MYRPVRIMVFWFGDLNYRLNFESSTQLEEVNECVQNGNLRILLENDQVRILPSYFFCLPFPDR